MDIAQPNALQSEGLPKILNGEDILCSAQTGSGKTLLFLLPFLQRILESRPMKSPARGHTGRQSSQPDAVIIVPSRDLARQIADVAQQLCSEVEYQPQVACVTGGAKYTPQRVLLREGLVRLLVGTPDRLLYHLCARRDPKCLITRMECWRVAPRGPGPALRPTRCSVSGPRFARPAPGPL